MPKAIKKIDTALEERFWNGYAKIYPHIEKAQPYQDMIDVMKEFITPGKDQTWVDLGCGPASMAIMLLEHLKGQVNKVIALDNSKGMLEHAKYRQQQHEHGHKLEVKFGDLSNKLDIEDNTIDGIISNLVLTYVSNHQERKGEDALRGVLEECYRVLKPGGQLVWSTPIEGVSFTKVFLKSIKNVFYVLDPIRLYAGPAILLHGKRIEKMGREGHYHFLPDKKIETILEEIGFTDIVYKYTFAEQAIVFKSVKPV